MAEAVELLRPETLDGQDVQYKRIQLKHHGLVVLVAKGEVVGMEACKAEAKSSEQKRQEKLEKIALHTATHKAAVTQAVHKLDHCLHHKDGDVSSLTITQMEAIAFVHLECPAICPLGYGSKQKKQVQFEMHRSASTWNGNNKRAVDLAGGDAGDAKRHKASPPPGG